MARLTTAADVLTHDGSNNIRLAKGTSNQVLATNAGATAIEWQDAAQPSPLTSAADVLTHDGSSDVRLAKGTANQVLAVNAGATALEWQDAGASTVAGSNTEIQFNDNGAFYGHIQSKHNMQWKDYKDQHGRCEVESAPFECKICHTKSIHEETYFGRILIIQNLQKQSLCRTEEENKMILL